MIIGYGNSLRSDDGVGWHVAEALAADPRALGVDVIAAHQLTPELAEDVHRASLVILVDAAVPGADSPAPAPGAWIVRHLDSSPRPGMASHHHTPASLPALAERLYGSAPPVVLVGVGVDSVDAGDALTPRVAAAVPAIVDLLLDLTGMNPAA